MWIFCEPVDDRYRSIYLGPVVLRMDRAVQQINTAKTYRDIQWIVLSTL